MPVTKPTEIMLHEGNLEVAKESIADLVRKMIALLGEDPNREGLRKTPERYEKALKFLTNGYHQNLESVLNGATFSVHYDEMVEGY
jgi:GTP cyclohydrolase I